MDLMLTKRKRGPLTVAYACFWFDIFDSFRITPKQAAILGAVHILQRATNKAVYHDQVKAITGLGPFVITQRLQELKDLGLIDGSFAVNVTIQGEMLLKEMDAELFRRIDSLNSSTKWVNQNKNTKVSGLMFPPTLKGSKLV